MTDPTVGCEEALRLLAAYLDHELDPAEEVPVRKHLETCRSCFSRAEFEKRLKLQLAGLKQAPVGPVLEGRVREIIHRFGVVPSSHTNAD
jgi:anti-sigma factor (TIGR02949 family)